MTSTLHIHFYVHIFINEKSTFDFVAILQVRRVSGRIIYAYIVHGLLYIFANANKLYKFSGPCSCINAEKVNLSAMLVEKLMRCTLHSTPAETKIIMLEVISI